MATSTNASESKSVQKKSTVRAVAKTLEATPKKSAAQTTPVRQTSVPPKSKAASPKANVEVTREMIAECAYHLWLSGAPGSEFDHWCAAERELRGK